MAKSKQRQARQRASASAPSDLRSLMNVGPAVEGYLVDLGIRTVDDLAPANPYDLFHRLERRIGKACDPCLYDTFCAIVHEARTGEKKPWFAWTAERKRQEAVGKLDLRGRN